MDDVDARRAAGSGSRYRASHVRSRTYRRRRIGENVICPPTNRFGDLSCSRYRIDIFTLLTSRPRSPRNAGSTLAWNADSPSMVCDRNHMRNRNTDASNVSVPCADRCGVIGKRRCRVSILCQRTRHGAVCRNRAHILRRLLRIVFAYRPTTQGARRAVVAPLGRSRVGPSRVLNVYRDGMAGLAFEGTLSARATWPIAYVRKMLSRLSPGATWQRSIRQKGPPCLVLKAYDTLAFSKNRVNPPHGLSSRAASTRQLR